MSVNYNRERHPLVQENRKRKRRTKKSKKKYLSITLPEPDTVHISILENAGGSVNVH